mgnify:CR=1 FL=1
MQGEGAIHDIFKVFYYPKRRFKYTSNNTQSVKFDSGFSNRSDIFSDKTMTIDKFIFSFDG